MRRLLMLLTATTLLGACAVGPEQITRTADGQRQLDRLLAGKAPGPPVSCLPSYNANDMVTIDDQTILFRSGSNRVYRADLRAPCDGLSSGHYALVTHEYGGTGLCRGDIARVADLTNGLTVGSCVFGDFVPYSRPRRS